MVPKEAINRNGERYGSLTVIKAVGGGRSLFKCDCGNEKVISTSAVVLGRTHSCSCKQYKDRGTHKRYHHKHYSRWIYWRKDGLLCSEWQEDIEVFIKWMDDNEPDTWHRTERIDKEKPYGPDNLLFRAKKVDVEKEKLKEAKVGIVLISDSEHLSFESMVEAARFLGISKQRVEQLTKKTAQRSGGYYVRRASEA